MIAELVQRPDSGLCDFRRRRGLASGQQVSLREVADTTRQKRLRQARGSEATSW